MKLSNEKLPNLVNVEEMAQILNVTKWWLYERTAQGQDGIPHYKVGKYLRFDPEEVLGFIRKQSR